MLAFIKINSNHIKKMRSYFSVAALLAATATAVQYGGDAPGIYTGTTRLATSTLSYDVSVNTTTDTQLDSTIISTFALTSPAEGSGESNGSTPVSFSRSPSRVVKGA